MQVHLSQICQKHRRKHERCASAHIINPEPSETHTFLNSGAPPTAQPLNFLLPGLSWRFVVTALTPEAPVLPFEASPYPFPSHGPGTPFVLSGEPRPRTPLLVLAALLESDEGDLGSPTCRLVTVDYQAVALASAYSSTRRINGCISILTIPVLLLSLIVFFLIRSLRSTEACARVG